MPVARMTIAAVVAVKTLWGAQLLTTNIPFQVGASLEGEIYSCSWPSWHIIYLLHPGSVSRLLHLIPFTAVMALPFSCGLKQLLKAGVMHWSRYELSNFTSYRFSAPRNTIHHPSIAEMQNIEGKSYVLRNDCLSEASHWVTRLQHFRNFKPKPWAAVVAVKKKANVSKTLLFSLIFHMCTYLV